MPRRPSRLLPIVLAILAQALVARAEEPESLRQKTHVFREGPRAQLAYQLRPGEVRRQQSLQLQLSYGITPDLSLVGMAPFLLEDTSPVPLGSRTPRIGGGLLGRPQVTGNFRLWSHGLDYLGVELGAALPIQSDAAARNSINNSWVLLATVYTELSFRPFGEEFSFKVSFSDYPSLPSKISTVSGPFFVDPAPFLIVGAALQWWARPSLAPYIGLFESFPTRADVVTDNPSAAVVLAQIPISRSRWYIVGLDVSPPSWPIVLSIDESYAALEVGPSLGRWQTGGRMRWAF